MTTPQPLLVTGKIYASFDRYVCTECAGMTALYTGVSTGGFPLQPVEVIDVVQWASHGFGPLDCECHRLRATLKADGSMQISDNNNL